VANLPVKTQPASPAKKEEDADVDADDAVEGTSFRQKLRHWSMVVLVAVAVVFTKVALDEFRLWLYPPPPNPFSLEQKKGWTQEEKENLAHFIRAAAAAKKARIMAEGCKKKGQLSPTDAARIGELFTEAVDEGKLVRDDVLAKVHPDLPKTYREKYITCLTLALKIVSGRGDAQEADTMVRLNGEWDRWILAHEKEMRFPKDFRIE
jgi:hypothetical protein